MSQISRRNVLGLVPALMAAMAAPLTAAKALAAVEGAPAAPALTLVKVWWQTELSTTYGPYIHRLSAYLSDQNWYQVCLRSDNEIIPEDLKAEAEACLRAAVKERLGLEV